MNKTSIFIFCLLVIVAMAFFLKLARDIQLDSEGVPEQREQNMEHYVEKGLE